MSTDSDTKKYYIYCLSCEYTDTFGLKKIGSTTSPKDRLIQYIAGDAPGIGLEKRYDKLWEINASSNSELKKYEFTVHTQFSHCRQKRGGFPTEWFKLTLDDLTSFMESQPYVLGHKHHEKATRNHYRKDFYLNSRAELDLKEIPTIDAVQAIEEAVQNYIVTDLEALRLYNIRSHVKPDAVESIWNTYVVTGKELQFWNIVREKTGRDIPSYIHPASIYAQKREAMSRLFEVIGITHSCETKTWTHAEFEAFAPEILSLEENLRKVMGLRRKQGKGKESEFLRASELLAQVLDAWSGSVVMKGHPVRIQNGKQRKMTYTITTKPLHDSVWETLLDV